MMFSTFLTLLPLFAAIVSSIKLSVASTGGNASSTLTYGLMFEDINHSGDGGIYAELIQNRAFQGSAEFPSTLHPWTPVGGAKLTLQNTSVPLSSALPTSLNVASPSKQGTIGLSNPGWWGIDVARQTYTGSFWALGSYRGIFTVKIQSNSTGQVFAKVDINSACQSNKWIEHKFQFQPQVTAPDSNNNFIIEFEANSGSINFNLISLFPPTYKNRPNGNRIELMEALKALNPSFLRMPGGNNIEGDTFHYPWKWNETIGPLTQRAGRPGTWGYENTDGLGLVEYLHWCDDLEIEPILAVWSGNYLNGYLTPADVIPESEIGLYVQDTMDELEFIMGSVTTPFGALRASLGYPQPWTIKYVEIGNEDNLGGSESSYIQYRFKAYYNAISAKYPDIIIISSTGDTSAQMGNSATDFHEYDRPDQFVSQFGYWDNIASRTHLTLIGEYASIQGNVPTITGVDWNAPKLPSPQWVGAIAETVFSLGAERNGYGIIGMSYAPGFQNVNSWEWSPDLVSFSADPSQTVLSTSYYAIELLSNARYAATVPVTSDTAFDPAYWVAGTSGPGKYTFKTAIYNATEPVPFNIQFAGLKAGARATLTVLTAPDGLSSNVLGGENVVLKNETVLTAGKGGFGFVLENYSIAVLTT